MKSIYTKLKGKVSRLRGCRNVLATAGSGGTGNGDTRSGLSSRLYAKTSTRSRCWDLSEQVLTTLTTAAQFTPVPYLSSLSAVALSIFRAVQGAKDNQEGLGELAKTACELASSVLNTYNELHPSDSGFTTSQDQSSFSSDPALNSHVKQLVETFTNVNDWITEKKSRKIVSKLVSYKSDLREIQKFQKQLRTAMDKFQLQSSITLRTKASQMENNNVSRHEQTQERLIIIHEEMQVLIRSGGVGAAVMNPNGPLTASIDSQPDFGENGSRLDAGFIQENVNVVQFGSVIRGNVTDHNIDWNPQDAVNLDINNLTKEHLESVILRQCINMERSCDTSNVFFPLPFRNVRVPPATAWVGIAATPAQLLVAPARCLRKPAFAVRLASST
ncbi:hypothetical protein C8R42DRAFT_646262 [Lentinula raphanica]|nr:hypothetical protein C8R42DRAFT_646262 [Lentinula raphanica]